MGLENEPASQQQQGNKYQVLLSYRRGKATQESLASRLCSSLRDARISVLKDDISIQQLRGVIECCEISIIIFSKHYASSRRCLQELTKIMQFCRVYDQVLLPIFYGVDPSDVREQKYSFGGAFQSLIQRISVTEDQASRWRTALRKAADLCGFVVPNFQPKGESEIVKDVVEHVCGILGKKDLFVAKHPVGVDDRVREVITMLQNHQSEDVVMVGIWGMGGVGKSTIAKAIYNEIRHTFDSGTYLSNIREGCHQKEGQLRLQSQLGRGLRHKKTLIVLNDVNKTSQLEALAGSRDWFGKGSRIIITTRDVHLLEAFLVEVVYCVKLLSDEESLELFSRAAFKEASPEGEFIELSKRVVAYCEGLPLALEVLGSLLHEWPRMEWESTLMKLSTHLPDDIYKALKPSFDSLTDDCRDIFLNIVLVSIGAEEEEEEVKDVVQKLGARRRSTAIIAIPVLRERSLVTIDQDNKLKMHNLLQLMGRQIIRETSLNELRNQSHRYEVFLSFRGEDTRATFTSHLYSALCNAGINVFKDDADLLRGHHISMELMAAIGSSKIAIIIFSKDYAGSKWCLEELSFIMELHKSSDQVVLPVFYDVDPSDIRNPNSSFGKSFKDLIQRISPPEAQVSNWRTALAEARGIAGIVILGSRDESENVKAIVENVCDMLDKKELFVADHPVGVDDRVQQVITMLQDHQSEDVFMVGLWGMGGLGKTTIAKAIYNKIGHMFESRCYLPNIREIWSQEKGRVGLQNRLLSKTCKPTKMEIDCVDSGKNTLSYRLRHKKALIVLDDVDELAQLKALVGSRDWFKPGSAIIITTRNKRLLHEMDCAVYPMKNLDRGESLKLFSWHAFKQESPEEDFTQLSIDIVTYSGGLPLALEVLGSYLFGREVDEWKSVLERLKKIPFGKIHEKLKISFDGLSDQFDEKDVFLDIASFFIGMDKTEVTHILNGCGFAADIGIKTLVERSLVTTDENNKLGMHDLLRDMGRQIVREQSESELGKRSRLWFHKDARAVLLKHMGTEAIQGLSLKLSESKKKHFQTKAFKMMKTLRLLHLEHVHLKGDYEYMSRDLRWLCWHGFPVKYIPRNFYQKKLVAIDIKYSSLTRVWKEPQVLKRLQILNLSHSPDLLQTPDFSKLPNLEKLILKDCPSLSMIHDSIGLLHKLHLLDMEDCIGLLSLPRSIYKLKCLKTLILSGCKNVEKLEEDIEQMESLTTLVAPTIKQAPFSLVRLKSILYLSLCGHEGLSHHVIPFLYRSWISPTYNPLPLIPTHSGMPSSILSDMLHSIHDPSTIIPGTISKQQGLLLKDGLEIPNSLCSPNCMDILRFKNCWGHLLIRIGKISQVFHTLFEKISQGLNLTKYSDDCVFPGDHYPYWLAFKGEGASIKFEVPPIKGCDHLKGMAISCVYIPSGDLDNKAYESCIICLMIINYTKTTTLVYKEDKLNSLEEGERKKIISNLESDDQVEVMVVSGSEFTVKKTTVYLIYNESFDEQMEDVSKCEEEEEAHQSIRPGKPMEI